mmetsp:Transcript_27590/g.66438  ORF Transcript_27590/g.66438 Transcript_27590/m.66438 type:complete len:98 (-) Transcript_27590:2823-3116(-)
MTIVVRSELAISLSNAICTTRSLSESRAEVASSSKRILGFFTSARAIAILCFWPPDSCAPPSPTSVSRPLGNDWIKSWAFAAITAASIASFVAPGAP